MGNDSDSACLRLPEQDILSNGSPKSLDQQLKKGERLETIEMIFDRDNKVLSFNLNDGKGYGSISGKKFGTTNAWQFTLYFGAKTSSKVTIESGVMYPNEYIYNVEENLKM